LNLILICTKYLNFNFFHNHFMNHDFKFQLNAKLTY